MHSTLSLSFFSTVAFGTVPVCVLCVFVLFWSFNFFNNLEWHVQVWLSTLKWAKDRKNDTTLQSMGPPTAPTSSKLPLYCATLSWRSHASTCMSLVPSVSAGTWPDQCACQECGWWCQRVGLCGLCWTVVWRWMSGDGHILQPIAWGRTSSTLRWKMSNVSRKRQMACWVSSVHKDWHRV